MNDEIIEEQIVQEELEIAPEIIEEKVVIYDINDNVERDYFKDQIKIDGDVFAYPTFKIGDVRKSIRPGFYNYSRNIAIQNNNWYRLKDNCWVVGKAEEIVPLNKIELPKVLAKNVNRNKFKNQINVNNAKIYYSDKEEESDITVGMANGLYDLINEIDNFYSIGQHQLIKKADAKLLIKVDPKTEENILSDIISGKVADKDIETFVADWGFDYKIIKSKIESFRKEQEEKKAEELRIAKLKEEEELKAIKLKEEEEKRQKEQEKIREEREAKYKLELEKIKEIAQEVIDGKWGQKDTEINYNLNKAGHNSRLVNEKVYEIKASLDDKLIKSGDKVKVLSFYDTFNRPFKASPSKKYNVVEIHGKNVTVNINGNNVIINYNDLKKVK